MTSGGAEERRNARARALGWSSRAQMRHAHSLGWSAPGDYAAAKADARAVRVPVQINPQALAGGRVMVGGVVRATNPQAGRMLGLKGTRAGTVYGARPAAVGQLAGVLGRVGQGRRVVLAFDGAVVGGRSRGFSAGFIRQRWADWKAAGGSDFAEFLEAFAAEFGYTAAGAGAYVSMTVV